MTFYCGLVEDAFDTLGRDDTLRHAYRVYLLRRGLGFVHPSRSELGPIPGTELRLHGRALQHQVATGGSLAWWLCCVEESQGRQRDALSIVAFYQRRHRVVRAKETVGAL